MADYTLAQHPFPIGSPAPDFKLEGVDGRVHELADYSEAPILVIVFMCNHCPYVLAYLDRLIELQGKYAEKGVQLIGINPNDESRYPTDSLAHMVEMVREKSLNFPYLRDKDQSIANAYHAERTPQLFVFDEARRLRYTGGVDDNYQHPENVKSRPLEEAIRALLEGRDVPQPEAPSIGCSVKWLE